MDQKVIIGILIVVGLLAAIGMPVLYNMTRDDDAAAPTQQARSASGQASRPQAQQQSPQQPRVDVPPRRPEPQPERLIWEGAHSVPSRPEAQYQRRQRDAQRGQSGQRTGGGNAGGGALNAQTLVGTSWQVDSPHGPVTVEFHANGQGVAQHSMVGSIPATWRVQGNQVKANASFMGQNVNISATIEGDKLVADGQNIRRVR